MKVLMFENEDVNVHCSAQFPMVFGRAREREKQRAEH